MDSTQLLLTIVLTLSTCLIVVIGIQLIFILRELRKTVVKVNRIIESFESLGTGVEHGLSEVTGLLNGFKTVMRVVDFVVHKKHEDLS